MDLNLFLSQMIQIYLMDHDLSQEDLPPGLLERVGSGLQRMKEAGWVPLSGDPRLMAAGEKTERGERFDSFSGYQEVDEALNEIF